MKIVAVNGSPNGKTSTTKIMVSALLLGAHRAGAKTDQIFLAEKNIHPCQGCYACWTTTPGHCSLRDDMAEVLARLAQAHIIVLATPLYFNHVSGTLKTFVDRLAVTGNPMAGKGGNPGSGQPPVKPKLVMVSNCGFAERAQFGAVSLWMKHLARLMQTEVAGEVYATQGRYFQAGAGQRDPGVSQYLQVLEIAGQELAARQQFSEPTAEALARCPWGTLSRTVGVLKENASNGR